VPRLLEQVAPLPAEEALEAVADEVAWQVAAGRVAEGEAREEGEEAEAEVVAGGDGGISPHEAQTEGGRPAAQQVVRDIASDAEACAEDSRKVARHHICRILS
jgi:hypothetical protein